MIINHNISAMNTYRQLTINNAFGSKSLEKLSSGLRINRAGDDAAGLAISEKMRGQIRGLNMAAKNAQDGISLIQTAEGALNETHSILQRMRELAVQSASDTNTAVDRAELQKEVDQLALELSRIGNTTEFNTQKLLDGNFKGTLHIGANEGQNIQLGVADMRATALGVAATQVAATETGSVNNTNKSFSDGTLQVVSRDVSGIETYFLVDGSGKDIAKGTDGLTYTAIADTADTDTDSIVFTDKVTSGSVTINTTGTETKAYGTTFVDNNGLEVGTYTYDATNKQLKDANGNIVATDATADGTFVDPVDDTITLFTVTDALKDGDTVTVGGTDISNQSAANSAISTIQSAIETVSAERSKLGAYQNRLDHTINNLSTASENLQAAESRIRDVDYAQAA